nr:MAG TPA: hypothetical protein [Caudoviricetes sp.]
MRSLRLKERARGGASAKMVYENRVKMTYMPSKWLCKAL